MAVVIAAVAFLFMQFNDYKKIMSDLDTGAAFTPLQTMADGLKEALSKFAKIAAIGIAVIGVALGLVLIAKAILMFTDILSDGNCKKGIAAAIVVVGGLVLIAALLAKVSQGLTGLGTAFLGLAAAVWIISTSINRFKDIDKTAIDNAMWIALGIGGIIAALMLVRAMTGSDLMGLAGTILGLAAAVFIIGFAVQKIGSLDKKTWIKGMAAIEIMLITMAGALYLLGKLPSDENGGAAVIKAAEALTSVAKELKTMAIVMALVGHLNKKQLTKGFLALVAPMAAIMIGLKLMARYVAGAEKNAQALSMAAKSIAIVAAVMGALSLIPGAMLLKGGAALLAVAVAMGIVLTATKKMAGADVTTTLIALAVAFGVFVAAMIAIGKLMSGGELFVGIVGMLVPLGLLIGALAILCALGKPLVSVGLAFLLFGAGLLMAAGAIAIFGVAIPALFTNLVAAAPKAVEVINNIGNAIWEGLCSFGSWLLQNGPKLILELIKGFFNTIIPGIADLPWGDILSFLGQTIANIASGLGNAIRENAGKAWSAFKSWLDGSGDDTSKGLDKTNASTAQGLDKINATYQEKGAQITTTVKASNAETATALDEAKANLEQNNADIQSLMNQKFTDGAGLADLIRTETGNADAAFGESMPILQGDMSQLSSILSGDQIDFSALGGVNIQELLGGMLNTNAFSGVATENITSFMGSLKEGMSAEDISSLASGLGINLDEGTIQGIQEHLPALMNVASHLGLDGIITPLQTSVEVNSPSRKTEEIGMFTALGARNGILKGIPFVKAAINTFSTGIITTFNKLPSQMNKSATKAMLGYALALRARGKDAKKAASDVGIASANAASKYGEFYSTGRHCVQGLIDGIRSKTREARQAATDLGNATSAAMASSVKVASPSKVFFSIGAFIVAGLVNAIVQNAIRAQRAAEDMGDGTIGAVTNAMAMLGRITDEDINYTPTITPVVDLSAAQFGFTRLNAMSDNLQLSIDSAINSKWAELEAMYERLNGMQVGTDNSDIVAAIESLKGDVAALGESMANMKVVLNRRIVGQIDNGLGQQQLLANRGV
jgi:hypothetical protein